MFKLLVVTVAALFAVFYFVGDESRRPEAVARAEPLSLGFPKPDAFFLDLTPDVSHTSRISDAEAVETALATARDMRNHDAAAPSTLVVPVAAEAMADAQSVASEEKPLAYWIVTGDRVNLRGGPGTSNPVVGQVTLGMEAEVLSDRDGWYEIRLADGSASGWIFGRFLDERRPG